MNLAEVLCERASRSSQRTSCALVSMAGGESREEADDDDEEEEEAAATPLNMPLNHEARDEVRGASAESTTSPAA